MARLFVPPGVTRELQQERLAHYARVAALTHYSDVMDDFNADLKQIDPYLELVKAKESIEAGTPLKPGYWHVIRHNPGAAPSIMTIEGPDGEYVEPSSAVFERLQGWCDLQNPAVERRRRQRTDEIARAQQRRLAREREEAEQETLQRYLAGTRTQVSMAPNWSQNTAGRRGRNG